MAQDKELTRIERDLVLQYLRDDNVPLTVTLEEKPKQTETELEKNKVNLDSQEKIPLSAVFPVAIPSKQIEVLNQGIILLKNPERSVQPFLGQTVRIQFYINRLGLYFITTMKKYSNGLAIVVPSQIFRVPDIVEKKDFDFYAELSFKSENNSSVIYDCFPQKNYILFTQPKWSQIEEENQVAAKNLLEKFVDEIKTGNSEPIENGLLWMNGVQLLSIVRFLTEKQNFVPESVEGRNKPFGIIYVDDKRMILSCKNINDCDSSNNFHLGAIFELSMFFTLSSNKLLKRKVDLKTCIEKIYDSPEDSNEKCFSLKFENLKEEDLRFIYERISGKVLS